MNVDPVFEKYLKILCYTSRVKEKSILGRSRKRHLCVWRYILWYYMHTKQGFGYYRIGKCVNRNHATVVHGIHCVEDFLRLRCYKDEKLHYWEFLINIALDKGNNQRWDSR